MKIKICIIVIGFLQLIIHASSSAQTPTTAAPTPPSRSASKVLSIFSNAYTDFPGTNYSPYWNQTTIVSIESIEGNSTLKFSNFNYQGFELWSDLNALPMTHLHIDIWTSDETSLTVAPISHRATNQDIALSPLTKNTWNSFDIDLSTVKAKWLSVDDIYQFIFKGAGGHTVYIDNMYFYNNKAEDDTEAPTDYSASTGLVTFNSVELLINAKDNSGAVFYEISSGDSTIRFSTPSGIQKSYTFYDLKPLLTYNFSVTAKDYSGNMANNSPLVIPVTTTAMPPAAPIPPDREAYKVISVFSDAYSPIPGWTNFFANWKQATKGSIVAFEGNETLKYRDFNYQGFELGSDINALPMTHLHIDVWTPNETSFEIAPVSRSKTNTTFALTPLALNTWNSYDIPLASVTGKWLSVSDIYQFMLKGAGGHAIYIDNVYFYDNSTVEDNEAPTTFTAITGAITFNSIELLLKANDNSGAVIFEINDGVYNYIVEGITGITKSFSLTNLSGGTDYNISVTVKDRRGNTAANSPIIVNTKTFEPTSAPEPTPLESEVISIFSDAYANIPNCNYNPAWNQATVFAINNYDNNEFINLSNLNYQGIELGSHIDVSGMKYLHLDLWTPNETSFQVALISAGKEKLLNVGPLVKNAWNSFDISLTSFTGVALNDVFQLKFVGSGAKMVYLDNLYFHKSTLSSITELNNREVLNLYPNPAIQYVTLSSTNEIKEVVIQSIIGREVKRIRVNATDCNIDISALREGNYLICVQFTDGNFKNEMFIKQ